jgi:hypothetical protein
MANKTASVSSLGRRPFDLYGRCSLGSASLFLSPCAGAAVLVPLDEAAAGCDGVSAGDRVAADKVSYNGPMACVVLHSRIHRFLLLS